MPEFIRVEIDRSKCPGISRCGRCVKVCPVNIFSIKEDDPALEEDHQDECTLCGLCLKECGSNAIIVRKLYET
jgi:NAD-dependent dihydropyrimidine dehydrogenase PreA subunit